MTEAISIWDDPTNPYDPKCNRHAWEMGELDYFIMPGHGEIPSDDDRREYVIHEEGTYNPTNGHFLCDDCYIAAGMPTAHNGWVCP